MHSWVVIPIKAPGACKTRLATVLNANDRCALVRDMLGQVVEAARSVVGDDNVRVLGPSVHGLSSPVKLLPDPGGGLNAAAASARDAAISSRVGRLLLISADLPRIGRADIEALLHVRQDYLGIAPDRGRQGTNALSLPLPKASSFLFQYGVGSFHAHRAEAHRLGMDFVEIVRDTLSLDIDYPDDLEAWREV
ncbi:2-phospho-L-lactate guanylyltransferase [Sphingobium sp. CR2-8]|uniref:2-phospho-L-lactate guanylyltransferase n=1 Tax=Sphingobium sp. CR2-8 TaxID=1306534 RepID=UPI002DBB8627|nr:2-phospho-L-lactate guanylyltransferase [Sphingobium sp. CR2-8]MEC3909543.1 2-phospho-L-lactate guanylyltransferase [Sphingobium sp. CR2-8]